MKDGSSAGRRTIRWASVLVLAPVGALLIQAPASARHNFSVLEVDRQQAMAGDDVVLSGFSYTDPVEIRFGGLDGQMLAELAPTEDNLINGVVKIPADTAPGRYILFAVQRDAAGKPSRFPGQAAVTVAGAGGASLNSKTGLELEERPAGLVIREAATPGELITVALAAVGAASLLSLFVFPVLSRRGGAGVQDEQR